MVCYVICVSQSTEARSVDIRNLEMYSVDVRNLEMYSVDVRNLEMYSVIATDCHWPRTAWNDVTVRKKKGQQHRLLKSFGSYRGKGLLAGSSLKHVVLRHTPGI